MTTWNPAKAFTKTEIVTKKTKAFDYLKSELTPGTIIYTILRHCSKSGMRREISLFYIDQETNQPITIDFYVAVLLDYSRGPNEGLIVNGVGMDMGYHIVNSLSAMLFRKADGSYSHNGAYALKHRWL